MKLNLLCLSILFFIVIENPQAQVTADMKFPNHTEMKKIEASMEGIRTGSTTEFTFNLNPLDQKKSKKFNVEIYKRPSASFPLDLHVWYLFEKRGKIASAVFFNWGLYNPSFNANENVDLLLKLNKMETAFVKKFEGIYQELVEKFGEPQFESEGIDEPHFLNKSIIWETEDRYIKLSLSFSRIINDFPGIGYQANSFNIEVQLNQR